MDARQNQRGAAVFADQSPFEQGMTEQLSLGLLSRPEAFFAVERFNLDTLTTPPEDVGGVEALGAVIGSVRVLARVITAFGALQRQIARLEA